MIVWRDRSNASRRPPALDGCPHFVRVELQGGGALVTADDPILLRAPATWHPLADQWDVGRTPQPTDHHVLAREGLRLPTLVVSDAQGQPWIVPAILRPDGRLNLRCPLVADPVGAWVRRPTPEQAALIQVAQSARDEILNGVYANLPIEIAAEWACRLLSATYHLTPAEIGALGLLDDCLLSRIPAAAAGHPLPE